MIKAQFPIFTNHPDLVYLDNATSVQKPATVIEAVRYYLEHDYANIHRGQYQLALDSEQRRWNARQAVASFLHCKDEEVIFTANSTFSVNLLSSSLVRSGWFEKGDIIVLSKLEHHANIIPRQIVAEQTGAEIVYLGRDETRQYDSSQYTQLSENHIKVVSLSLVSNVTGQKLDTSFVKKLSKNNFLFILDGSQAAPHMVLDVSALGCDALYFTGHKLGALTGIGVLYGQSGLLKELLPGFSGGGAIQDVTLHGHTYQLAPDKFEPGTPNVVAAISLHEALKRIGSLSPISYPSFRDQLKAGFGVLTERERELINLFQTQFDDLLTKRDIRLIGLEQNEHKIGIFSFILPSDIKHGRALDLYFAQKNICTRMGAHCAHPLHAQLDTHQSIRASLRVYNDVQDIERFFDALRQFLMG